MPVWWNGRHMDKKKVKRVYGPYLRKDGRKHVIIIYENGERRTVSYPKYLMEIRLGRILNPLTETIDHIDRNFNNNDFENLRIISLQKHIIEDKIRVKKVDMKCVWCGKIFKKDPRNFLRCKKEGKAGPFCSRKCRGIYGASLQNGYCEKIKNKTKAKIIYVRMKKDV